MGTDLQEDMITGGQEDDGTVEQEGGGTDVEEVGGTDVEEVGGTDGQESGDTDEQEVGETDGQEGGDTDEQEVGETDGQEGGETGRREGGVTVEQEGGEIDGQESGETDGQEGGETGRREGGETDVKEVGETHVKEGGVTDGQEGGETDGQEGGETGRREGGETDVKEVGETDVKEGGETVGGQWCLESAVQSVTRRHLLPHETQMLLELLHADGLLVSSRGLCVDRLLSALVRIYSHPACLVLVVGATSAETRHLCGRQSSGAIPPRALTAADTTPAERSRLYLCGGVMFVTSRILLVDLLTDRCPADLLTGVLVYRAHAVNESALESFILRLYRQKNKTGFVKAFSSSAVSFTAGYCQVERVMRNLYVRELFLWPRFHAQVRDSLHACTPDVVELHVAMTPLMSSIQTALLDLINISIKEFKRLNTAIECDELTVECVLSRAGLRRVLARRVDPVWHQLSARSRQLVGDVRTLRHLLVALLRLDCCSYYQLVAEQQSERAALSAGWCLLDEAETLFVDARRRVFGQLPPVPPRSNNKPSTTRVLQFEKPPKWRALSEALDEVRGGLKATCDADQVPVVLVIAGDAPVCRLIKQYLRLGAQTALWRRYQTCLAPKFGGSSLYTPSTAVSDTMIDPEPSDSTYSSCPANQVLETVLPACEELASVRVLLLPLDAADSPFLLADTLELHQPRHVVMYDSQVAAIRTLEVHQSCSPQRRIRVYTLMYSGTCEEQAYLTELRAEKEAFEYLIQQKSQMVVPEQREGRDDEQLDEQGAADTRQGGAAGGERSRVIVDTREFRSELPALLHRRGLDVVPATIEVGDYVLSPDVCVERKSIGDLIGSLLSGRLYTQADNMTRHYRSPLLLIEFDHNKPFSLQGRYYVSSDMSSEQIVSRLQLLTLHFPQLRLLWCASPYASAELLHRLKDGAAEPSLLQARALTTDTDSELLEEQFNPQIRNFISKLPGVDAKNIFSILNQIETLSDLIDMTKERLSTLLSSELSGSRLYHALNSDQRETAAAAGGNTGAAKRPGGSSATARGRCGRPRFWKQ